MHVESEEVASRNCWVRDAADNSPHKSSAKSLFKSIQITSSSETYSARSQFAANIRAQILKTSSRAALFSLTRQSFTFSDMSTGSSVNFLQKPYEHEVNTWCALTHRQPYWWGHYYKQFLPTCWKLCSSAAQKQQSYNSSTKRDNSSFCTDCLWLFRHELPLSI